MKNKYQQYSVEDFVRDEDFIRWVKTGAEQKEWEQFLRENPHMSPMVEIAREMIDSLRFSKEKTVTDEEIHTLWKEVKSFHTIHHQDQNKRKWVPGPKKIMQYAAVFVLMLSLGAAIPLIYFSQNKNYFSEMSRASLDSGETRLIFSDGEEVLSKEKQTDIRFDAGGEQVQVNRDSVIQSTKQPDKHALTQIIVPFGKISNVELADGTKIWLNAGSRLLFPQKFEENERKVFLTGEAYFDVAKDKTKPFIVNTGSMHVTVLGTEFNVRDHASDQNLEVVLVEGEVSLKENKAFGFLQKETRLLPDQRATYDKQGKNMAVERNIDVAYYTSWKEGLLKFNRESVRHVFERLARYYHVRFVTEKDVELNGQFSGKLDLKESLEDVLKVVSNAAPITFRMEEDHVYVYRKMSYLPMK